MRKSRQIFDYPLSSQRYSRVKEYIEMDPEIRTVTDFGCGNGRSLLWLKQIQHVQLINCVDVDYALLEYEACNQYFEPSFAESLFGREKENLQIRIYHGDITVPQEALRCDCLVMIEVIEHMYPADVDKATRSIFGYYKPTMVIITTPNSEFNHLLREPGESSTLFRHYDHKFEWTRAQFQIWAREVCQKFNYQVHFDGVGHLPNSEPFGPCTQIAIFRKCNNHNIASCASKIEETETFDLLFNKLSVDTRTEECSMERSRHQLSLIMEYRIPSAPFTGNPNNIPTTW